MLRIKLVGIPAGIGNLLVLALVLVGAWLGGCASQPDAAPIPKPRVVLLAPTRFDPRLEQRLEPGVAIVDELLGNVLWADDVEVHRARGHAFRDTWLAAEQGAAVLRVSSDGAALDRHDGTVRALVQSLQAEGERFDALVIPYLTVRPGVVTGHSVHWDGVTRRLPLEYRHRDSMFLVARRGLQAPCTSLRVIAYDARGNRLFERLGGLEVAKRMRIEDDGRRRSWSERSDLFQDPQVLRDGVQIALRPLLRE
jgi:hypothetical protein